MQGVSQRLLPVGHRRLWSDGMDRHDRPGARWSPHDNRGNQFHHRQPCSVFHGAGRSDDVPHPVVLLPARLEMTKGRIRNNVRKLRFLGAEMTQQELAEKIGGTRQTVIAIEQDKYSPSLEVAFRIARVFGVPLEEVFQYETADAETGGGSG